MSSEKNSMTNGLSMGLLFAKGSKERCLKHGRIEIRGQIKFV